MPKTVITGGAGFLGSHLCDKLLAKGHHVVCIDNLCTGSIDNIDHIRDDKFTYINQDVTEYLYLKGDVDFIIHFASPASPIDYMERPIPTLKVGSLGTHKALGLARERKRDFCSLPPARFTATQPFTPRQKTIGETSIQSGHAAAMTKQNASPNRSRWPITVTTDWKHVSSEFSIPTAPGCG